jgi:predicted TIM-barrel fold metal-dependent hydrolase
MKIIDGQMHVFPPNTPQRPWPAGTVSFHGDHYTAEAAIAQMDDAGVRAAVLVPLRWMGADNSCALEAAAAYPDRFVVRGRIDARAPDARRRLDHWRDVPGLLGIRLTVTDPVSRALFVEGGFDWFWSGCQANRLPLMCYTPGDVGLIGRVADRYPDLRLIVDHAGRAARGPKDAAAWHDIADLLALAGAPNVAVKVSSLPSFSTEPYPFVNLHAPIRAIYDSFGPQRMIWGSDVTRLTSTYEENVRLFSEALDFLSPDDREWLFWRSISRWCDVEL